VPGKGFFFRPYVFEEKHDRGFSTDEEFFGPVASLFCADNMDHAVQIANSSEYGLGSAVYTRSAEKASQVALQLENGFVYINSKPGLHPYIPFGGVKRSGIGKDCGESGYKEFSNEKVIVQALA
jgi:acyl-CoA reductase-like NAD-dependent aldehyde dehydrogenase